MRNKIHFQTNWRKLSVENDVNFKVKGGRREVTPDYCVQHNIQTQSCQLTRTQGLCRSVRQLLSTYLNQQSDNNFIWFNLPFSRDICDGLWAHNITSPNKVDVSWPHYIAEQYLTSEKLREWPQTWPFYPLLEGEIIKIRNFGTTMVHQILGKNFYCPAIRGILATISNCPYRDTHGTPKMVDKWHHCIHYTWFHVLVTWWTMRICLRRLCFLIVFSQNWQEVIARKWSLDTFHFPLML